MGKPSQKKFEKKKRSEKETRKNVIARRLQMRKQAREDREKDALEKATAPKIERLQKVSPQKVFVPPSEMTREMIEAKIKENLQKLKALEENYRNEMIERDAANAALEAEGYKTIEEKMNFLKEQAEQNASKEYERAIKTADKKVRKKQAKADK